MLATVCWLAACGPGDMPPTNETPHAEGSVPTQTVGVGETVTISLGQYFSDADGDQLTYAATSSDESVATASVSGETLTLGGVSPGSATVVVTATDPGDLSAEQSIRVTVPNRAPTVSEPLADVALFVGQTVEAELSQHFSDPDGDDLFYSAGSSDGDVARPRVSAGNLQVASLRPGAATVTVTARDPGGLLAEQSFTVTVPNQAPMVSSQIADTMTHVGETFYVELSDHFIDPDGEDPAYTTTSSDEEVVKDSVSRTSLIVEVVGKGTATVTVVATDPGGLSAEQSFTVTVPNRAPTVSDPILDVELFVGGTELLYLSGHFSDPDGDELTYEAESSDPEIVSASVSADTLFVSGVSSGTAILTVTATDPGDLSAEQSFIVTVLSHAPAVSGATSDTQLLVGETVVAELRSGQPRARVVAPVRPAQVACVEVGVELRRRDVGVAE